jgi:hypothetical protein
MIRTTITDLCLFTRRFENRWDLKKLSGTDTSRNSPVFSRPGYGSLAISANNLESRHRRVVREPRGYSVLLESHPESRSELVPPEWLRRLSR